MSVIEKTNSRKYCTVVRNLKRKPNIIKPQKEESADLAFILIKLLNIQLVIIEADH